MEVVDALSILANMHLPLADIPPALPFRDDNARLLAELSHEIRTPLTAMLGYADYLLDATSREALPDDSRGALHVIQTNSRYLLELVNSILDWARLDAGGRAKFSSFDPVLLVQDVVELLAPRGGSIALRLLNSASAPRQFVSDPLRLRQILLNLVGNALKFTTHGEVCLSIAAQQQQGRRWLQIEVRDTGLGMTAEQVAGLFLPFMQADAAIAERFGGTGLGLAISRRLCELLGGELTVESAPGEGSLFRLAVPEQIVNTAEQSSDLLVQKPLPAYALRNRRLLLAEDSRDTRRLVALVLRQAGAEVCEVDNGCDAYTRALASQPPFDAVLMDVEMPVWSGLAAAQQLRCAGYQGYVVAISASEDKEHRLKCAQAGFDDYVAKPIDRFVLLRTLTAGLTKRFAYEEPQFLLTHASVLDPH